MRHRGRVAAIAAAIATVLPLSAFPLVGHAQEEPVIHPAVERGALIRTPAPDRTPSVKTVDGDPSDWIGEPTWIGGQGRYDAGEYIYTDYLYDAWGADDGTDAQRLQLLGPAGERRHRADAFFQAAGEQFGAPQPVGALDHYGDDDGNAVGDVTEVRFAYDDGDLLVLLQFSHPIPGSVSVAFHHVDENGEQRHATTCHLDADLRPYGDSCEGVTRGRVAELRIPAPAARRFALSLVERQLLQVVPRPTEPVAGLYNEQEQALVLMGQGGDGSVYSTGWFDLDVEGMRRGRAESVGLGPGYHERVFLSSPAISREDADEQSVWQRYGLYVPESLDTSVPVPATWFLHYRGGKAHSGAAWSPNLMRDLGDDHGSIVVSPHGRGTSGWYVGIAHEDFWEVYDDVHSLFDIDPQRRYLTGYSMGGMGTWLMGVLYPDRFAAGFPQSGAVTAGLWTGEDPDTCGACVTGANDRDGQDLLTYRLLGNLRHFPVNIDHGTNDELVPITGIQRMALRLRELGYRYQMTTYPGWEHYTQAIVDEWESGAAYINRFTLPEDPRHVTYSVSPAMVAEVNRTLDRDDLVLDHQPDGAWWVDDIVARNADTEDPSNLATVDAVTNARPGTAVTTQPIVGAVDAAQPLAPFVRHGQDWAEGEPLPVEDTWTAALTNVASVTFDVERMGFTFIEGVAGDVTTDGETAVTFTNLPPATRVSVDGEVVAAAASGTYTVALGGGPHQVWFGMPSVGGSGSGAEPDAPDTPDAAPDTPDTGGGAAALAALTILSAGIARRQTAGASPPFTRDAMFR